MISSGTKVNTARFQMSKVYFVSAGPGDPELITIKGRKILDDADVVIYAGSLVNPELLKGIKAEIFDSSKMTLDEIMETIRNSVNAGKMVVRLHTGDTSLYSAISEQIERLRKLNIEFEVIPGVSSAMAGAAILGQELTIPEISQTVIFTRIAGRTPVPETEKLGEIFTRIAGRTPVPETEKLGEMAMHRASMVLFLSVGMIEKVRDELLKGYPENTPVAVIYKASWPDQKIIRGSLKNVVELVKTSGIKKTALIYVGEVLKASTEFTGKRSRLYHEDFKHEYRK
jgi:precorrin-4/cobalt-precorrin-4 C11-methyltransferase